MTVGIFNAEAEALKAQPAPGENQALTALPFEGFPLSGKAEDGETTVKQHTTHIVTYVDGNGPGESIAPAGGSVSNAADFQAFMKWKNEQETKVVEASETTTPEDGTPEFTNDEVAEALAALKAKKAEESGTEDYKE